MSLQVFGQATSPSMGPPDRMQRPLPKLLYCRSPTQASLKAPPEGPTGRLTEASIEAPIEAAIDNV